LQGSKVSGTIFSTVAGMSLAPNARNGHRTVKVVIAQRIIRRKGDKVGNATGKLLTFESVTDVVNHARSQKKVYHFTDSDGNIGIARSIRSSNVRTVRIVLNVKS
jgi:hypothetical protein